MHGLSHTCSTLKAPVSLEAWDRVPLPFFPLRMDIVSAIQNILSIALHLLIVTYIPSSFSAVLSMTSLQREHLLTPVAAVAIPPLEGSGLLQGEDDVKSSPSRVAKAMVSPFSLWAGKVLRTRYGYGSRPLWGGVWTTRDIVLSVCRIEQPATYMVTIKSKFMDLSHGFRHENCAWGN